MLNSVWVALLCGGVLLAVWTGRPGEVTEAAVQAARGSVELTIGLAGLMALWMGLMKVAEEAGLTAQLARLLRPLVRPFFPDVPAGHPALGAVIMNLSANLLGLGSAATPLGLKAMRELQQLNPDPDTASPAMCTFLALNTSAITLVPGTVIALRAAAGSYSPAEIVLPALFVSLVAAVAALSLDRLCRRLSSG